MKCCAACFSHETLRELVSENSEDVADCDYCGSKGVQVINASAFHEYFRNLMQLYVRKLDALCVPGISPSGTPLLYLIQDDYEVFSDRLWAADAAGRLLEDFMKSGWDD